MSLRRLSLRDKFLLLLATVLVAATLAYLGIAVQLFNKDKKAYILDNNAALAEALGEEVATGILSSLKTMRLAAVAASNADTTEAARNAAATALFRDDDNFVALKVSRLTDAGLSPALTTDVNDAYLASYQLDRSYAEALAHEFPPPLKLLAKDGVVFQNAVIGTGPPLLAAFLSLKTTDAAGQSSGTLVVEALLRQDRRLSVFQRSSTYTAALIDAFGNVLAHADPKRVNARDSLASNPAVQSLLKSGVAAGAYEYRDETGVDKILAYKKLGIGGLAVLSEITKEKAFFASRKLVERSAILAIFVLSLSFIPSIIFSRRLTSALHRLYLATQRIAKGEFDFEVKVASGDEVGALSASFNHMSREISRLLVETADKARMEKELETAQLVQDNFFPKEELTFGPFAVASFFKPASECGGDWWGSIQQDGKLILLIGDATGHGVPAALITAAAHSCTMTLSRLAERLESLPLSPAFIMDSLNAAIFHAGRGRVKMTFFVLVLDSATGSVRFANASHELPLICRDPGEGAEATKEHLDVFDVRPDPCLGESLTTVYREHEAELGPGDTLLLYTDGIVECQNKNQEEYGERRLTRSLLKVAGLGAPEIKERLVSQALAFYEKTTQEDDITLVVLKRARSTQVARIAS